MRRVFLVEDEDALRETLGMFLEELGCEVIGIATMAELEQVSFHEAGKADRSTLFLIDQNLQDGNGLDFISEKLNSGDSQWQGKSMAIMSAALTAAELKRAAELGCHIFEKPIMYDDLEQWLASAGQ